MIVGEEQVLLKSEDVCMMLGISVRTLRNLVRRGEIPHLRIGRLLRFDPNALERWINAKLCSQAKARRNRVSRSHAADAKARDEGKRL